MPRGLFPIKNSVVILDTCVLQYLNKKEIKQKLSDILKVLEKNNNILRISDITSYELFSECPKGRQGKLLKIHKKFPRYVVHPRVIMAAAKLATVYRFDKNVNHQGISDGDKILGATSYLTGSYILTANGNDFPRPFFKETHIEDLELRDKKRKKVICFYFLKANIRLIENAFENRPQ